MAHSAVHFSAGLWLGTLLHMKPYVMAWLRRARLAPVIGRMLVWSYGLAVYAVLPGILEHIGLPAAVCRGWWMNIFVFHHLLGILEKEGLIVGAAGILGGFACHYTLLMAALMVTRRRRRIQQLQDALHAAIDSPQAVENHPARTLTVGRP
jgi:hypothetical protein